MERLRRFWRFINRRRDFVENLSVSGQRLREAYCCPEADARFQKRISTIFLIDAIGHNMVS